MMGRCLAAISLAASGCGGIVKSYRNQPCLPDGEPAGYTYHQSAEVIVSFADLDVLVSGNEEDIAFWFLPMLIPIPFPIDAWDHPGKVAFGLELVTRRKGYIFSPERVRLTAPGRESVAPSGWRFQPYTKPLSGTKLDLPVGIMALELEFPLPLPLEERVELQLEGIEIEGVPVEIPTLFLQPAYSVALISF